MIVHVLQGMEGGGGMLELKRTYGHVRTSSDQIGCRPGKMATQLHSIHCLMHFVTHTHSGWVTVYTAICLPADSKLSSIHLFVPW